MADVGWFGVDWGTSRLRLFVFDRDDSLLESIERDQGMGVLERDRYEALLMQEVGPFLGEGGPYPVVCCGMVGARQGWSEAPYVRTPCDPCAGSQAVDVSTESKRLRVVILSGVAQEAPADVMRGEETTIAGFLVKNRRFEGVLCVPGTHAKWIRIRGGQIVRFRTFMTGELYSLLSMQSVLRHSFVGEGWCDEAFSDAVNRAVDSPDDAYARFFSLRAEALLGELDPGVARARLSGLLIGLELHAAHNFWRDTEVALIGAPSICSLYERALKRQGLVVETYDGDAMTRVGLRGVFNRLRAQGRF